MNPVLLVKRSQSHKSRNREIAVFVENPIYYSDFLAQLVEKHRNNLAKQVTKIEELFKVRVNNYSVKILLIDEQYVSARITEISKRGNKIRRIDHVIPATNDGGKIPLYIPDYLEKEINGLRELIESYNLG